MFFFFFSKKLLFWTKTILFRAKLSPAALIMLTSWYPLIKTNQSKTVSVEILVYYTTPTRKQGKEELKKPTFIYIQELMYFIFAFPSFFFFLFGGGGGGGWEERKERERERERERESEREREWERVRERESVWERERVRVREREAGFRNLMLWPIENVIF